VNVKIQTENYVYEWTNKLNKEKPMSARSVTAAEIRAAKKWLERRDISAKELSPRKFAKAAKMLDKGFRDTLQVIANQLTGGQV